MAAQDIIIFETNSTEESNALIAFGKALKLKFKIAASENFNIEDDIEIPEWHKTIVAERLEDYKKNPENVKNFDELLKSKREKYGL